MWCTLDNGLQLFFYSYVVSRYSFFFPWFKLDINLLAYKSHWIFYCSALFENTVQMKVCQSINLTRSWILEYKRINRPWILAPGLIHNKEILKSIIWFWYWRLNDLANKLNVTIKRLNYLWMLSDYIEVSKPRIVVVRY